MERDKESVTIVVFSGELDKALASFNIATTAAAMGMDVTMFFTFWGLNVIKKNEGPLRSRGLMRKMLNWMNRGGSKRLKLSRFNMLGLGARMIKKLMREDKMPSIEELIAQANRLGVKLIACTTSMGMMDLGEDAFIPEVDSFAGAATFLGQARKGTVNLFI
ncbi:MAG: DsrE/DsrF/DrsH-like family protein [Anaerolineales bacterium]|nr:DsrE/DsrF/DrsH-like family protein [Anaerolineales bacterium]